MLMHRYTNQQLTVAEAIAELIALARLFDAAAENESAVAEQGEVVLSQIARDMVGVMRRNVRIDWTVRDDVRAKLRSSIKPGSGCASKARCEGERGCASGLKRLM